MNRCYQLCIAWLAMTGLFGSVCSVAAAEVRAANEALEKLMEGNQRYVHASTVCREDWGSVT